MTSKLYDILKIIAILYLPIVTSLVTGLGKVWGWDAANIAETLVYVDTALGAVVTYYKYKYDKESN